jgi:hypothetical protein
VEMKEERKKGSRGWAGISWRGETWESQPRK